MCADARVGWHHGRQVVLERDEIKARNDREEAAIDALFEDRQRCGTCTHTCISALMPAMQMHVQHATRSRPCSKEQEIKAITNELQAERQRAEALVSDMPRDQRQFYTQLKEADDELAAVRANIAHHRRVHASQTIQQQQSELDVLNSKLSALQQDLAQHPVKQQAGACMRDRIVSAGLNHGSGAVGADPRAADQEQCTQSRAGG